MKNIPDTIFDEALVRLHNGDSVAQIASDYKDYQEELVGLLSVAQMGIQIPKINPPAPYKAYKFATVKPSAITRFIEMVSMFKVATVPIALLIVLLGGPAIASATKNSLPGDTLYSLKRATEQVQLSLTQNQNQVANLHVELMQKRLDEVKKAAQSGNDTTETLALAELKSQTEKTFAEAGPVATANAISNNDSSLLDNLVAVNKEQKSVLTELSADSDNSSTKTIASTALADSKKNDQTLAKILATVNDQILADSPNKVSVTGTITYVNFTHVTVEKNTFTIDSKTEITNIDGTKNLDAKNLNGRATIIGNRTSDGTLLAKQITLLPTDSGEVKGDSTAITTTKPPVTTKPPIVEPKEPEVIETDHPIDNTKAQGSFITEPANSQYAP